MQTPHGHAPATGTAPEKKRTRPATQLTFTTADLSIYLALSLSLALSIVPHLLLFCYVLSAFLSSYLSLFVRCLSFILFPYSSRCVFLMLSRVMVPCMWAVHVRQWAPTAHGSQVLQQLLDDVALLLRNSRHSRIHRHARHLPSGHIAATRTTNPPMCRRNRSTD